MASPFRYFRKHTKAFMAIASVIAIGLFVFGRGTGSSSNASDNRRHSGATVATWKGGSINEGQLAAYVQHRLVTNEFLRMLFAQGGGRTEYDLPATVPNFVISPNPMEAVELEVINAEVFSSLATQAGMTVSDGMVNHYLQEFGLGRVDSTDIVGILGHLGQGNARSNETMVFGTLRKLLLAYFYRRGFEDAGAVVLPEQRWEDWRRVNERISLEVAKLPVESFLDKVGEPTEADLKKLYEEFKEADPNMRVSVGGREMPSPNPAFAIPRRVKLQYLLGSVAERTKKLLDSVTEAEIADYYERNKRDFIKSDASDLGFDSALPPAEGAGTDGTAPAEGTPPAGGTTPEGGATATPAEGAPAAEGAAPAASESSEPPATPSEGTGAPAAPAGDAPAPATGSELRPGRARSPFRFAALQAATADVPPATTEASPAATAPAEGAPAEGAAATDPAASPGAQGEATGAAIPAAQETKPGEGASATSPATTEPEVEYEPLDKVRDQIRETLAREKAVDELRKAFDAASTKLLLEFTQYGRQVAARELTADKSTAAPPAPSEKLKNLQWLADQFGLSVVTTESLTVRELYDLPVGKATDDETNRVSVTQAAFSTLELFEPFLAKEIDGDWYLVTKIEDTPRRVPTFDEVRDQVAAAWKRIEAGKLAEKAAKELAEASEKDAEPFAAFFKAKEYDVVPETALFSWRTYPFGPGMGYAAELTEVPELKNVGPDFMEAAFGLEGSKTVGMLNYDHSMAYVFRLHSRQYTPDELKKLFLAEDNTWPGRIDMMREHQGAFSQTVNRRIWEDLANFKFDEEWEKRRAERLAARD